MVLLKVPSIALVEELPSFPRAETEKETIDRILGYEYKSKSVTKMQDWIIGGNKCECCRRNDVSSMNVGAVKKELEHKYSISTVSFLEKSEF
jgi:hypothetical protein